MIGSPQLTAPQVGSPPQAMKSPKVVGLCLVVGLLSTWILLRGPSEVDTPGARVAEADVTPRHLEGVEEPPTSVRDVADAPASMLSLHVVSERGGTNVAGALLIGGEPLAVLATTDVAGVAMVDRASAPAVHVWHPAYQLATIDVSSLSQSTQCRIRPRPVVACVMDEADYGVISAHSFMVSVESRQSPLLAKVLDVVGAPAIPAREWSGFGKCELLPFDAEGCTITVVARSGAGGPMAVTTVKLGPLESYCVVPIRWVPPLSAGAVNVKVHALLDHPEDRDVVVFMAGPIEPDSGQPITGFGSRIEAEGRSNHVITKNVTLVPGVYSWGVMVIGLGTFSVGRFTASIDGEDIRVRGRVELVKGTIGVHGVDRTVDLRAMSGLETVSGQVLEKKDAADGYAEWSYCLPKNAELFAVAIVRDPWEVSAPVRIPTERDGGHVDIRGYAPYESVMFRIDGTSREVLRCVEVRDDASGMVRTTQASAEVGFGPMLLTHGPYSARLLEGPRTGLWVSFRVPGDNPVVLFDW